MDSQLDNEIPNNILENDINLVSGGELDTDLLVLELNLKSHEQIHTTKPYSILNQLVSSPPIHNSTNTTTSTTSSTISHSFFFMITTRAHSTNSTANPTLTL